MPEGSSALTLRADALDWRAIEGEVIALEGRTATYLSANRSGSLLWDALARGTTRAELVALLGAEFGIDDHRAAADVDAFLSQLAEHDLLADERP